MSGAQPAALGAAAGLGGVLGGAGPLATAYFLELVVRLTDAAHDQGHADLLVLQHASIPDRTAHIVGRSPQDPGPVMAEDARRLERWGASFIVVPCNTAHHYLDEISAAVGVPVVSIVGETVAVALRRRSGLRTVGVLATEGTIAAGVYQGALARAGVTALVPDAEGQDAVSEAVYAGVKAGRPVDGAALARVVDSLLARGAQLVLLGCTELSVAAVSCGLLDGEHVVDSLDALARTTILRSGHRVRDDDGPAQPRPASSRARCEVPAPSLRH